MCSKVRDGKQDVVRVMKSKGLYGLGSGQKTG